MVKNPSANAVHTRDCALIPVAQRVKHLPAVRETWVQSLGGEDSLEKEMATHSSILAWKTPWMEKPGGLQSMESQSRTRLSDFTFTFLFRKIPCRTKWQLTLVFLSGESQGQRSLADYSPWGGKELDTAGQLSLNFFMACTTQE